MTLKEFTEYLHKHTGYRFYIRTNNEYSVYGFTDTFKGYLGKEKGKFYVFTLANDNNAILKHPSIRYQRIICYKPLMYSYHAIYEISLRQDKATHS